MACVHMGQHANLFCQGAVDNNSMCILKVALKSLLHASLHAWLCRILEIKTSIVHNFMYCQILLITMLCSYNLQFADVAKHVLFYCSLGSRHFDSESRPVSGTRLTPLDHVSYLQFFNDFNDASFDMLISLSMPCGSKYG